MKPKIAGIVFLAAIAAACQGGRAPEPAPSKFSLEQLQARYYMDLGPSAVDTASYTQKARDGYPIFVKVCSQCHTLARPLNAPEATRAEWEQHVRRMHEKTLVYGWWTDFGKKDAEKILDFLEHDSKVRKLDDKAGFAAKTDALKALLKDVEAERERLQLEEGRKNVKPAAPYVGAKP
jgi:cytochrome c5